MVTGPSAASGSVSPPQPVRASDAAAATPTALMILRFISTLLRVIAVPRPLDGVHRERVGGQGRVAGGRFPSGQVTAACPVVISRRGGPMAGVRARCTPTATQPAGTGAYRSH